MHILFILLSFVTVNLPSKCVYCPIADAETGTSESTLGDAKCVTEILGDKNKEVILFLFQGKISPWMCCFLCLKCSKIHLQASSIPKCFSGVIPRTRNGGERRGGEVALRLTRGCTFLRREAARHPVACVTWRRSCRSRSLHALASSSTICSISCNWSRRRMLVSSWRFSDTFSPHAASNLLCSSSYNHQSIAQVSKSFISFYSLE